MKSSAGSVSGAEPAQSANKWVWLLAFSPVVFPIGDSIALFANLSHTSSLLVTLGLQLAILPIAILDSREIQKIGIYLSGWWWLLLPPLYLLMRAFKLRSGWVPFVAWVGTLLLSAVLLG